MSDHDFIMRVIASLLLAYSLIACGLGIYSAHHKLKAPTIVYTSIALLCGALALTIKGLFP